MNKLIKIISMLSERAMWLAISLFILIFFYISIVLVVMAVLDTIK